MELIAVIGSGRNAGKTTAVEGLVREFKRRGLRVGTIKQIHEPDFTIDTKGKDSWRHAKAGADMVVSAAAGEVAAIKKIVGKDRVRESLAMLEGIDPDVVIVEGDPGVDVPMVYATRGGGSKNAKPVNPNAVCIVSLTPEDVDYAELPVYHTMKDVSKIADIVLKDLRGENL